MAWLQSDGHSTGFTAVSVEIFQKDLIESGLSPSTVNMYLTAIRRMAAKAAETGSLPPDTAFSIGRIKGVSRETVRVGTRLTLVQAEELIATPNAATLKGKRDRALLAVLIACGLRREEAAGLTVNHFHRPEGKWVIRDIVGKGRKLRSVPVPSRVKTAIDGWIKAAAIQNGRIFRAVNKGDRVIGDGMTAQTIFEVVKNYAAQSEFEHLVPDDLRRLYTRWVRKDPAALEEIRVS